MIIGTMRFFGAMCLLLCLLPRLSTAETTRLDVRVLSKGAKFIGSSMGGAQVIVKNAATGAVLSEGIVSGTTGDTAKIMKEKLPHHAPVSTADAGVFRATLDLDVPTEVEVIAYGPLAQRQSMGKVSATVWLLPGKHVTGGDGLTLMMPGLLVDVLDPPAHQRRKSGEPIEIRANVQLMCGCPIEPDGLWNANEYEVTAYISRGEKPVEELRLSYAGSPSQFSGSFTPAEEGVYLITVAAYHAGNGNTGLDKSSVIIGN